MEQIINITYDENHQQPVVSSLQVAEDFNKQHAKVIRAIEQHILDLKSTNPKVAWFYETTYTDKKGELRKMYLMNRDGFSLLVMSFNNSKQVLNWKIKYIEAFNAMEQEIKRLPVTPEEKLDLLLEVSKSQKDKVKQIDERVVDLEENQRLDAGQYGHVGKQVSKRIAHLKDVHKWNYNKKQNGELFHALNKDILEITGVHTRTSLRQKDFDKVCQFISSWEPSKATLQIIEDMA